MRNEFPPDDLAVKPEATNRILASLIWERPGRMFHSTIFSLKQASELVDNSAEGEFDDPEMILTTQPNFLQYHRRSSKSLIISPFTLTQAFSQDTIILLPTDSEGAGSPLLHRHPANSLGSTNSGHGEATLDFISGLPTEISIQVLLYLQPQDLCNASVVSSRWYQLTQCDALYKKRRNYLQQKREEYQKSKENCAPRTTHPQLPMSQQNPATFTQAPSPLGNIQPSSPSPQHHHQSQPLSPITWDSRSHTSSPILFPSWDSRSHASSPTLFPSWDSRSHTSSPTQLALPPTHTVNPQSQPPSPSPRSHTSSPTLLVDDVNRLSLEDCQDIVICRPLSPDLLSTEVRGGGRSLHLALRQVCKEVAGRKLNKNRLRRL